MAEREGFEPPEQLPVHRISSAARSTTPASLLVVLALITVCKSTMFVRNDQKSSRDSVFGLAFCGRTGTRDKGVGVWVRRWDGACGVEEEESVAVREGKAQTGGEKANVHFVRHRFMCNFATIYYRAL